MNVVDIIILIILAWGAFRGFTQGFVLQVVTFIALILGVWASIRFSGVMSDFLTRNMDITGKYLPVLSFVLIFVLVIVLAHLTGMLLTRFMELTALGWLNRIGGVIFGVLKMAFIISVLLTLQNRMKERMKIISDDRVKTSILYKPVSGLAPAVFPHLKLLALDKRFNELKEAEL